MTAGLEFLVLEASFLAKTYGGAEWPPAPFRLLQAIVAGCRSITAPGLAWLEQQPAPFVLATDEPAAVRFERSISNNADPRTPTTTLRDIIHRQVSAPVWYCYRLRSADDRAAAEQVIEAATQLHTLGTGEDMCTVRGLVTAHPPESNQAIKLWTPMPGSANAVQTAAAVWLRVPAPGSLRSLEERFQAFQTRLNPGQLGFARPVSAPAWHGTVCYRTSDEISRTALLPMKLMLPDGSGKAKRFQVENAVVVAGRLRHGVMRLAETVAPHLADFAAGYGPEADPGRRMSWVPLPSIGHTHADGMIRRALLMCRAEHAEALAELVAHLPADGVPLVDEATGETVATAVPVDPAEEPVLGHYFSPATQWASVTPVILPGEFGAGNIRLMNNLMRKAVREAGIDPGLIAGAEFSKFGYMQQAARLRDVKLKDWTAKHLLLYHVRLRFRAAVRGPLVLGRGRHFGLGLFCADPE